MAENADTGATPDRERGRAPHGGALGLALALIGVVVPAALAIVLAVGPGPLTRDLPSTTTLREVSLGTAPGDPLPVPQRKVAALSIAPQNLHTLTAVFDRHDYALARIATGEAAVPPIFVKTLPHDWRSMDQAETRKRVFVKTVLPLIVKANAAIRTDRKRLLTLAERADGDPSNLSEGARYWLSQLARRYGLDSVNFAALKRRVDVIPASLAIAQAANESGWGTSRFARQGNALFGQWTWDSSEGIRPKALQAGKGDYAVKRFDSLGASVAAYMHNLNTHSAYAPMRKKRASLRAADHKLSGSALAGGLTRYSQRGAAYVEEIRGMISYNDFHRYDGSHLANAVLG